MKQSDFAVLFSVIEAGSFSKAAERLGYTPAGVSYIISEIERELGMPIFNRNHNGVKLNGHGMDMIPELKMIYQANLNLENKIRSRKEGKTINLYVGLIDTVASEWLPDAMVEFEELYPDVRIDVMTGNPYELNDWMESGLINIMVTEEEWIDTNFISIPIYKDLFYMVFPNGSDVPEEAGLDLMEGRDVITPFYGGDRTAEILLRKLGIDFNQTYDRVNNQAVIKLVAIGKGAAILPGLHLREARIWAYEDKYQPEIVKIIPETGRELVVGIRSENKSNELLAKFTQCIRKSAMINSDWEDFK